MRGSTLPSISSIIDTPHIWRNCKSLHIDQIKFAIKWKVKKKKNPSTSGLQIEWEEMILSMNFPKWSCLNQAKCFYQEGTLSSFVEWLPGSSDGKESACNAGYPGSVPWLGRYPGEGNGYPLQYSGLENSTGTGAWQATVHGVTESDTSERLSFTHSHITKFHLTILKNRFHSSILLSFSLCACGTSYIVSYSPFANVIIPMCLLMLKKTRVHENMCI